MIAAAISGLSRHTVDAFRRRVLHELPRLWPISRSVQVKLIEIGRQLVRHARRLVFQGAEVAMPRVLFQGALERIAALCPAPS